MDNKAEILCFDILKTVFNSIALAGLIILMIGLYYMFIKAGLPYQDPPIDLQIEYAVNSKIGDILTLIGLLMTLFGVIVRVIVGIISGVMLKSKRLWRDN